MDIFEETWRVIETLDRQGIDYALVGAVALAIHGVPRATIDVDLLVLPDQLEAAVAGVRPLGFDIPAKLMRFRDGMELQRITKIEGEEALILDFILVGDDLECVWESRQALESTRGPVKVVSREALILMKAAAGRDQDLADIRRLRELDR